MTQLRSGRRGSDGRKWRLCALVALALLIWLVSAGHLRAALGGFSLTPGNWEASEDRACQWGADDVTVSATEDGGVAILTSRQTVSGDFKAEVSFALEKWCRNSSSMELAVYSTDEKRSHEIRIGREWKEFTDTFAASVVKGSDVRERSRAISAEPEGRLQILRRGGQVRAAYRVDGGWDTLQLFDMYENEELKFSLTVMHDEGGDEGNRTAVRFFDLKVEKLPPIRKPGQGGGGAGGELNDWVIYATEPGWLRVGSRKEFDAPWLSRDEIFGGQSEAPLAKKLLKEGFASRDEALEHLCRNLTKVHIRYSPTITPKEITKGIYDGKEYMLRLDRGNDPDMVLAKGQEYDIASERQVLLDRGLSPRFYLGRRWLVHATGHGTIDGPAKDDKWVLITREPLPDANNKNLGYYVIADGMGGTFTYSCDKWEGPYCDNYGLTRAMDRLGVNEVDYWPPGNNYTPKIAVRDVLRSPTDYGKDVLGVQPIVTDERLQDWYVYLTEERYLHIGTATELDTPVKRRETLWLGQGDELVTKKVVKFGAKERFFTYEQAFREVLKNLADLKIGFDPTNQPREYLTATFMGKKVVVHIARDPEMLVAAYGQYDCGAEVMLLLDRGILPLKQFKRQWLVHATGHGTYYGPVKDDFWMMVTSEPQNGGVTIADGMGGTFGYSVDKVEGPFEDNVSLAQALKRNNVKSVGLAGEDRGVSADEVMKPRSPRIEPPPRIISLAPDRGEAGQSFYVTVIAEGMKPWFTFSFGEGIAVSKETYLGRNPDGDGERWLATVNVTSSARLGGGLPRGLVAASQSALPLLGAAGGSAILNEKGAVVGTGPGLTVGAPKPPVPEVDPKERYFAAVRWLSQFMMALNTLEKDMITLKVALRENCIAYREALAALEDFEKTGKGAYGDKLRDQCERGAERKKKESAELYEEQSAMIKSALARWDDLAKSLADKIEEVKEFSSFQGGLKDLQTIISKRRTLGAMELYLSAGRSEEFRGLAAEAQNDPAMEGSVRLMRVADYIDRKEGRLALYCARAGLEKFPKNSAFEEATRGIEIGFLRMISSKAAGDAEAIHRAWNDYSASMSDSRIKEFFFGNLSKGLARYTGKADALAELSACGHDLGVMEHNGLEVMIRLREKGFSFESIRAMSTDDLKNTMNAVFGLKSPMSDESAKGLSLAVRAAFRNDDVKRLMVPTAEKFDFESSKSYYGAEEFDKSLIEYATDAVSVKNAIIFLGPSAMMGTAKAVPGLLGRVAQRAGVSEKWAGFLNPSRAEEAISVRDWIFSRPKLEAVTKFIGNTRGGAAIKNGLEAMRALRYDSDSRLTRVGMAVADIAAQVVLFETGSKVGHALGGEFGAFIGEALGVLVGGGLEVVQARHITSMKAAAEQAEKMAKQMANTRARWEATNKILEDVRVPVRNAVEKVSAGEPLAAGEATQLERAVATADDAAASARRAIEPADSGLPRAVADEADSLATAGRAAKKGEATEAQIAEETASKLETGGRKAAEDLKSSEAGATRAAESSRSAQAAETGQAAETAEAAESARVTEITGAEPPPSGGVPPGEVQIVNETYPTAVEQTGRVGVTPPASHSTGTGRVDVPTGWTKANEAEKLADDMMAAKNYKDAGSAYRTGYRQALEELNNPQLEARYRDQLVGKLDELKTKAKQARQAERFEAQQAAKQEALRARGIDPAQQADEALKPFTEDQREYLKIVRKEHTVELPGAGGARKIFGPNGEDLALWKPQSTPPPPGEAINPTVNDGVRLMSDGQKIAEVLAHRVARKLGLRVPYAEPHSLFSKEVVNGVETLVEHKGVIIRWVPETVPMAKLSRGARATLKDQVAKFRALQVLMGNYDIHMNNYLVDATGRVWGIDNGAAFIRTPHYIAKDFMPGRTPFTAPEGDNARDWTRMARDWYGQRDWNIKTKDIREIDPNTATEHLVNMRRDLKAIRMLGQDVRHLDGLIKGKDMSDVAKQIKGMTDDEIDALVDGVMKDHKFAADVKETLKGRAGKIDDLLEEKWPGVKTKQESLLERLRRAIARAGTVIAVRRVGDGGEHTFHGDITSDTPMTDIVRIHLEGKDYITVTTLGASASRRAAAPGRTVHVLRSQRHVLRRRGVMSRSS